ncbi:MAG: histidine kinase, partial [Bacteroidetes bacterium]
NGILGFSTLLINSESSEKQRRYANIVNKSCKQLLNIVNDTVEISKVHSEQAKVIKSMVNISSIVSETISEFKESAFQKGIDIKLELNLKKEQLLIEIDAHKIERVFWHLIDNAIKFTYTGHIKISGHEIKNSYIQFQIEDTGIGIPSELQEKIFDPFRQVESGATRKFGGNGIGLSLAKAYTEIIGGKIWLKSQIEKGTTVLFTIPVKESVKKEAEKQIVATGDINNKTILIAEDNELNFILISEILFSFNIKLLHAWNGKDAVEIFMQQKQIDLILMDLKMPVMDGYEALKKIKSINPNIPIIAQTAYASDTDKEEIKLAGFDDYITKPINEDKLVQMLKQRI